MNTSPPPTFVLASNLYPAADVGISHTTQAYLDQFVPGAHVERLGSGIFRPRRIAELWRLRKLLIEQLTAGTPCLLEGYKSALFSICALGHIRRAPVDQLTFLIHDAGSPSHIRNAQFWAVRLSPHTFHRLYRATLDFIVELLVLRSRRIVVVSQAEVAKVWFTDLISIKRPPGAPMRPSAGSPNHPPFGADDVLLYADLRVPHLKRSVADSIGILARRGLKLNLRLVIIGRQPAPQKLLQRASAVFAGGVIDQIYLTDLAESLTTAGTTWVPDLAGSGVKNRTVDALRYAPRVLASEIALEGALEGDLDRASVEPPQLFRYESLAELPAELLRLAEGRH